MRIPTMKIPRMQTIGHYRRRGFSLPGQLNKPRRGRPGKSIPQMKRLDGAQRRGR